MFKIDRVWKKLNTHFCRAFLCKTNLRRDAVIISATIVLSAGIILSDRYSRLQKNESPEILGQTVALIEVEKAEAENNLPAPPMQNEIKPETKKVASKPAPKSPVYAPGVKFTNDRKRVSCKARGGDHKPSPEKEKHHYDEDCCIDRDEWLQPGCTYHYNDIKYSLNIKKSPPAWKPKK